MEIYPIDTNADNQIERWKKKNKPVVFTKLPFTALVYGSSGTGKSTMVANIFLRGFDGLNDFFLPKNIYIFAKNGQSDVNFRALMIHLKKIDPSWDNFSAELDIPKIRDLIDKNRKRFDAKPTDRLKLKHQILLLIDDQIQNAQVHGRSSKGEIVEIAVMGRHACVSSMILVQNITSINHVVRRNATHIFSFRLNAQSERQKLFDDLAHGFLTKKIISDVYDFCISDQLTSDGQGIGFLTYRPYIQDVNQAFMSSFKRKITFSQTDEEK